MRYILAVVSLFLTPYILFDIINLYQLPYLVTFSYPQIIGLNFILTMILLGTVIIVNEIFIEESRTTLAITILIAYLLIWGLAYLTHWFLVNYTNIKIF